MSSGKKKVQTPRIPRRPNLRCDRIEQPRRAARKILDRKPFPPVRPQIFFQPARQLAVLVRARSAIIHHPTPARPLDWRARAVPVAAHARHRRHVSSPPRPAPEVAARGRGWAAQCRRAAIDFPLMTSMMGAACPPRGALRLGRPALFALCVLRCQAGRVSAPSSACHHVDAGAERGAHGGALGACNSARSERARARGGGGRRRRRGAARRGAAGTQGRGDAGTRGRGGGSAGAPLLRATHATPHGRAAGRGGSSPSSGAASRRASLATQAVEPRVVGGRGDGDGRSGARGAREGRGRDGGGARPAEGASSDAERTRQKRARIHPGELPLAHRRGHPASHGLRATHGRLGGARYCMCVVSLVAPCCASGRPIPQARCLHACDADARERAMAPHHRLATRSFSLTQTSQTATAIATTTGASAPIAVRACAARYGTLSVA